MEQQRPLRVLSLFAGIGAFDIAAEAAGFQTIAFVEKDEFCRRVLRERWPEVPLYDDVRDLDAARLRRDGVWPIDCIIAGPPCQPASAAGRRRGNRDERWLWGEALRITGDVGCRWAIFENPIGLLSLRHGSGEPAMGGILAELSALGYVCGWGTWGASDVGAPHRRERVFIVARRAETRLADASGSESQRWREAGLVAGTPRTLEAGVQQRQWLRDASGDRGPGTAGAPRPGLADAGGQRREQHGERHSTADTRQPAPQRGDAGGCDADVANADRAWWGSPAEGGHEPDGHDLRGQEAAGRPRAHGAGDDGEGLALAQGQRRGEGGSEPTWSQGRSDAAERRSPEPGGAGPRPGWGVGLADTHGAGCTQPGQPQSAPTQGAGPGHDGGERGLGDALQPRLQGATGSKRDRAGRSRSLAATSRGSDGGDGTASSGVGGELGWSAVGLDGRAASTPQAGQGGAGSQSQDQASAEDPCVQGGDRATAPLLAQAYALARAPRWPARPGERQHAWEAPRLGRGIRDRVPRLRGLGNCVVPAQAYVLFAAIAEWEQSSPHTPSEEGV